MAAKDMELGPYLKMDETNESDPFLSDETYTDSITYLTRVHILRPVSPSKRSISSVCKMDSLWRVQTNIYGSFHHKHMARTPHTYYEKEVEILSPPSGHIHNGVRKYAGSHSHPIRLCY